MSISRYRIFSTSSQQNPCNPGCVQPFQFENHLCVHILSSFHTCPLQSAICSMSISSSVCIAFSSSWSRSFAVLVGESVNILSKYLKNGWSSSSSSGWMEIIVCNTLLVLNFCVTRLVRSRLTMDVFLLIIRSSQASFHNAVHRSFVKYLVRIFSSFILQYKLYPANYKDRKWEGERC